MIENEKIEPDALQNYNSLKVKVNNAVNQADQSSDLKLAREKLKEVQSEFKGLKLLREHREELYQKVQQSFERLNMRQEKDRELYEKEAYTNYSILKVKVELN